MITSSSNPLVKRIRRLRQKKYRQQEGVFYIEGLRVVLAAIEHQASIETIVFSSDLLTSDVARQALANQQSVGTRCVELSAELFDSISQRDNPVGLGAIVAVAWQELENLDVKPADIFIALVDVSEPGNLGAVMRTVDAVGGAGLLLAGHTVDPFHPTAVKASMGTLFSIPVCHAGDIATLQGWATTNGLTTIATSAHAKHPFWQVQYRFPALLLLGSEGAGLPSGVLDSADLAVSIPMQGAASSLNLAVAAGIMLYELARTSSSGEH